MPGVYDHWVTAQTKRSGSLVYHTAKSTWTVVAMANDFEVVESNFDFMIQEQKELSLTVKNTGVETSGIIITIVVNNRFKYIPGSAYCVGYESIDPSSERYEGGSLYLQFPDSVKVPAGGQLEIRFPVETN